MAKNIFRSILIFIISEARRGTLRANMKGISKMELAEEMSWAELLEEKARKHPNRTCVVHEEKEFTFKEMHENACRTGSYLKGLGGSRGSGVAIFMDNSSRFLDIFIGQQTIGMYAVPVNTSLQGDGMTYILNHCDAQFLIIDEEYLPKLERIKGDLTGIKTIIVNSKGGSRIPAGYHNLDAAYKLEAVDPGDGYSRDDICVITYTSGTTGLPKGVVYRYKKSGVKLFSLISHLLWRRSDVFYTCMPLFHANALLVTCISAIHTGGRVVLEKKFSASRFWESIRKHKVTTFNTIGAMIPILMKQPESDLDSKNSIRFIISAACPPQLWEAFEKRFGLTIYETYGAVDGGGKTIMNLGTAPVGSIGKPPMKIKYRLVDEVMNDVTTGEPGELIFPAPKHRDQAGGVEFYKNEKASAEKQSNGWTRTGDVMRRDKKGYLYFVGRNTESMRIKGENVSAYEVEQVLQKHPAVLEAAVYAVPSDLAEDEIMASIKAVDGESISGDQIIAYARENLAKFAVPRYVRIVENFEKTETHRIRKKILEEVGVIPGTWDSREEVFI